MELAKIRNLGDEELAHQGKVSAEQLFRLRFQVSMGQNDGVKKLRQLRKEIAQIKTVARERQLGIHGETRDAKQAVPAAPAAEAEIVKAVEAAPAAETKTRKTKRAAPAAEKKAAKAKKATTATETKTAKAKGARK
jgi:large subunit ribosomal protein L29